MKDRRGRKGKKSGVVQWAFSRENYTIFAVALAVLMVGYWSLAQEPVDGFLTMTLAPVLLIFAYCVLIPFAIIHIRKESSEKD